LDYDPGLYGHVMTRAEYAVAMKEAALKTKSVDPDVKVIASIETDWVNIDLSPHEINDLLGEEVERGFLSVPPDKSNLLIAAAPQWADSVVAGEGENHWLEYYGRNGTGAKNVALNVYPTSGNTQAKFLWNR